MRRLREILRFCCAMYRSASSVNVFILHPNRVPTTWEANILEQLSTNPNYSSQAKEMSSVDETRCWICKT